MFKQDLSVSKLTKANNLFGKKSLGQHYIFDPNLTNRIVRSAGLLTNYHVIEIGPGPGSLTRSIMMKNPKNILAIEKDIRFKKVLQDLAGKNAEKIKIVYADALQYNFSNLFVRDRYYKIIANLPYNVSLPLLFKFLEYKKFIKSLTLLFQKEVANRILASPKNKAYGRVSVVIQNNFKVEKLFDINPGSFSPKPKVFSTLINLYPKKTIYSEDQLNSLSLVTKAAFSQRRKMLKSNLKKLGVNLSKLLKTTNISLSQRAEEIPIEEFLKLAQNYDKIRKK